MTTSRIYFRKKCDRQGAEEISWADEWWEERWGETGPEQQRAQLAGNDPSESRVEINTPGLDDQRQERRHPRIRDDSRF